MSPSFQTFSYRLARPGYSVFPGAHPGEMVGSGQLFKRHESLLASPDPQRIDLRASLLDPFGGYRVRVFQQHSKLNVYAVADLSASMGSTGIQDKRQTLAELVLSIAESVRQAGDSFGFIGCGERLDDRDRLPAGAPMPVVRRLTDRLRSQAPQVGSAALAHVGPLLSTRRSLVFLISDCHFSLGNLPAILQPLSRHAVVPLVLWQAAETAGLPDWGLVRFQDAENRRSRTMLMRPDLKQRIADSFTARRQQLRQGFRRFGMEPLFLTGPYRAELLTAYFLGQPL